jgi:TP901 family phage tail tape measure protein
MEISLCKGNVRAAGASIELVSAMAGVMGDAGIQGTMAGTAMRSMFTRMVAPAKDAKKHMAQNDRGG